MYDLFTLFSSNLCHMLYNILQGHTAQHQHRSDDSQTPSSLFGDKKILSCYQIERNYS